MVPTWWRGQHRGEAVEWGGGAHENNVRISEYECTMTGAYRGGDVEHTGEGVELVGRGGRLAGADWSSNELSRGPRTT